MSIKDKIMAVPNPYDESLSKDRFESMKIHCAEVAQASENELLAELKLISQSNESLRNQNTALDEILAKLEQALQDVKQVGTYTFPESHYTFIRLERVHEIIDKALA